MDIFTSPLKPLRLRQCRHVLQLSCLDGQGIPKKWTWRLPGVQQFRSPSNLQDLKSPTARAIHPYPLHHRGDSSVEPPRQDLSLEMSHGLVDTPTNRSHDHMDGEGTSSFHVICQVKKNRSFLPKDVATSLMGVLQYLWISVKILVEDSLERGKDPMNRDGLLLKGVLEINPTNELMDCSDSNAPDHSI